jgi:hypothetical protein
MASELKVDKFTGVTTAGSIDVTGEGNSTTTNLQQGLCKVWVNVTGDGFTLSDNFNASSMTDNAVGRPEVNFTNAMANATYGYSGAVYNRIIGAYDTDGGLSTTSLAVALIDSGGSFTDILTNKMGILVHGDLA